MKKINMKSIAIFAFVFMFTLMFGAVFAIGILPSDKDLGILDVNKTYNISFNLTNLYSNNYTINVSFELVRDTQEFSSYVSFPSSILLNSSTVKKEFNIILNTQNIRNGNYTIVFRPKIRIIGSPNISNTGSIDAGFLIGTTATGTIKFIILSQPPITITETREVVITQIAGGGVVTKYRNIEIEAPWFVETIEDTTINIRIKNIGTSRLENLTINLASKFPIDMEYNKFIGTLLPDEQKNISVLLKNFSGEYNFIQIIISDLQNEWTSSFIVRTPELRAIIEKDCIEFEPIEFLVPAEVPYKINVAMKNRCGFSLHNIYVVIDELLYNEYFNIINDEYKLSIDANVPEGEFNYTIVAFYDEGMSKANIKINAVLFKRDYLDVIILVAIIIIIAALYIRDLNKIEKLVKKKKK